MQTEKAIEDVRIILQQFQDGYRARDLDKLDDFLNLFVQDDDVEFIGIAAVRRSENEWFQGLKAIGEIVESDWKYWGNIALDVAGARIHVKGDVAWLTTTGELVQTESFDQALEFYLNQMKEMLQDEQTDLVERLVEATHFGMRRLRERHKGEGHAWPFVFSGVLVRSGGMWRFHTIHWSMPVD